MEFAPTVQNLLFQRANSQKLRQSRRADCANFESGRREPNLLLNMEFALRIWICSIKNVEFGICSQNLNLVQIPNSSIHSCWGSQPRNSEFCFGKWNLGFCPLGSGRVRWVGRKLGGGWKQDEKSFLRCAGFGHQQVARVGELSLDPGDSSTTYNGR